MTALPCLVVAPTGALLTRRDHPALPVSLPQIVASARTCREAGADGLHLHLRDAAGRHTLDPARYREALAVLRAEVPGMAVQIAGEAAGRYDPAEQRAAILAAGHASVAVPVSELCANGTDLARAPAFYAECAARGIEVQHVLHSPGGLYLLRRCLPERLFHDGRLEVLYVLGRAGGQDGRPGTLARFLLAAADLGIGPRWMACAHGPRELACLRAAHGAGGRLRTGFATNRWSVDGTPARDNAARVAEIAWHTIRQPVFDAFAAG